MPYSERQDIAAYAQMLVGGEDQVALRDVVTVCYVISGVHRIVRRGDLGQQAAVTGEIGAPVEGTDVGPVARARGEVHRAALEAAVDARPARRSATAAR